MISNLTFQERPGKRDCWVFRVESLLPDTDLRLQSSGWRYYPHSGTVSPPCTKMGARWSPTVKVSDTALEAIKRAVLDALGEGAPHPWVEYFDMLDRDPFGFAGTHPRLFRGVYRARGRTRTDNPQAWDALFERLDKGRDWPDPVLESWARLLAGRQADPSSFHQMREDGVMSPVDYAALVTLLEGIVKETQYAVEAR